MIAWGRYEIVVVAYSGGTKRVCEGGGALHLRWTAGDGTDRHVTVDLTKADAKARHVAVLLPDRSEPVLVEAPADGFSRGRVGGDSRWVVVHLQGG